jgi:hypothetical protein
MPPTIKWKVSANFILIRAFYVYCFFPYSFFFSGRSLAVSSSELKPFPSQGSEFYSLRESGWGITGRNSSGKRVLNTVGVDTGRWISVLHDAATATGII